MASQAPGTFLSDEFIDLSLANASERLIVPSTMVSDHVHTDPANWTWEDYQRRWFEQNPIWQRFADQWRNDEDLNLEAPLV